MQALEYGAKIHAEELHLQELGIATLSALFANANRDPKKGQPASPADFFYFAAKEQYGPEIPAIACELFFSLIADQKLPGWVLDLAPIADLRRCRSQRPGRLPKPRAWVGENLLIIGPTLEGNDMGSLLSFDNGAVGLTEVCDIDTGTPFFLKLPESPQIQWSLSAVYELFDHGKFG